MQTIRQRFWLWGMKVNALQETSDYARLGFATSTLTVEQAMRKTGVANVIMAGGLPIVPQTLSAMPSARRIICKTSLHRGQEGGNVMDYDACLARLMEAKALALADPRIEGFHIDDFSTGTVEAGVRPKHLARMQFANAVQAPFLPLSATMYTMSLARPELPGLLPHLAQFLLPLCHADQIDTLPAALDRLSDLSGGKPMLLCLYLFDFGNGTPIPRTLMERQLHVAETMLGERRVTGLAVCGTCMMDLDWESARCLFDWLERVGDRTIEGD